MAGDDDLLDPNEIEALLNQTGGGAPEPASPPPSDETPAPAPAGGGDGLTLDASEIEALMAGGEELAPPAVEQTLGQAEANLAAAVAPDISGFGEIPAELGAPSPFSLGDLGGTGGSGEGGVGINALQDVEFDLHVELGRTDMLVEEVLTLKEGAVVPLDKLAGDPVDIIANGRLVARGEVLVLNDNFCVRVAEILTPNF